MIRDIEFSELRCLGHHAGQVVAVRVVGRHCDHAGSLERALGDDFAAAHCTRCGANLSESELEHLLQDRGNAAEG